VTKPPLVAPVEAVFVLGQEHNALALALLLGFSV
jgi:hypothetical protein